MCTPTPNALGEGRYLPVIYLTVICLTVIYLTVISPSIPGCNVHLYL